VVATGRSNVLLLTQAEAFVATTLQPTSAFYSRKENPMTEKWVALYSASQRAYHVKKLEDYRSKPANGDLIIATCDSRENASAVVRKQREAGK